MNAEIEVKKGNTLTLPEEAIVNYENKTFAFTVKGPHQYEITEVKTGVAQGGYIEVSATAKDLSNQTFVTKGAYTLLMKMKNTAEE
jgi:cobalt-zinc-cadmium efflux system membrane fusion protein